MSWEVPREFKSHRCVTASKKLDHDIEVVWALVSSPGNLLECHPFCRSNEAIEWGDGSFSDVLTYLNGRRYVRRFRQWRPREGYDLVIGEEGGKQSFVRWELNEAGNRSTELRITVYPYLLSGLPRIISAIPFSIYARPKLTTYLRSVLRGFEYFLDNGERVPRNYFGSHSWFS
ncbi:MAG: SRPBCC family protein [Euryarchaeota archaeon]|jgi:hypothetical protein